MKVVLSSLLCLSTSLAACSKDTVPASEGPPAPGESQASSAKPTDAPPPAPKAKPTVIFETANGDVPVQLEVVSTPARIQRGLMHREHLAPDHGMLFVFAGDRIRSFWMKNTLIPLDMLFVTKDLEVAGVVRNTTPLSLEGRSIDQPTRYVIEVNGGWTEAHGVDKGTKLRLENIPKAINPPW